ncbi:ImmA/IrrE family metallo-endopeptidase [Lachnospiraceae bacterium OttesenSCG-928-D06]|nr:ImmA/IrrE family metallo-endopeptidase [Lachnospiraceae bacterium OttesenSCG-928-D06]
MNDELRMLINNLTQDIIDLYDIQVPIKDINDVVKRLGGRIEESFNIDNMSDGSVRRQGNGFVIFVSPFQGMERRIFTIAHELGHLFLHMGYRINSDLWERQEKATYYRAGDSLEEYQANEFAAALLMPKKKYKEIMDKNTSGNMVETGKIASYFGVSVSAASNRGKFLGYLQW